MVSWVKYLIVQRVMNRPRHCISNYLVNIGLALIKLAILTKIQSARVLPPDLTSNRQEYASLMAKVDALKHVQ